LVALLPILLGLFLPMRIKGPAFTSVLAAAPSLGAGVASAGIWIGVLKMFGPYTGMNVLQVAFEKWDHLLLIVLASPAIVMNCTYILVINLKVNWKEKEK